jgi:hypothetical protein
MGLFDRFKRKDPSSEEAILSRDARDGIVQLKDSDFDTTDEHSEDEKPHSILDDIKDVVKNNDVELHPSVSRKRSDSFIVVKPKPLPKTLEEQIVEVRSKLLKLGERKNLSLDEKEDLEAHQRTLRELVAQQRARSANSLSKLRNRI